MDRPQNSSSLDLREPVTFFPPMESRSSHLGMHFWYTCLCYGLPSGLSLQGYPPWCWFVPSPNSLAISLCCLHVTISIYIKRGMAEWQQGFWKCKEYWPVIGWYMAAKMTRYWAGFKQNDLQNCAIREILAEFYRIAPQNRAKLLGKLSLPIPLYVQMSILIPNNVQTNFDPSLQDLCHSFSRGTRCH